MPGKIILLDSNAIIHRAFHALPPLSTKSGVLTNAVYGYALALLSVLEKFQPDGAVATFDLRGPTFRHVQYDGYKAKRKKAPDELYDQIPLVKDLVRAFGIPIWEKEGFEADDMIGTFSRSKELADFEKIIITGDLDALQLVDEKTKVYVFRKGIKDAVVYDQAAVKERFGLDPVQLRDYKGLRGDASDNIPGVKGIGEKTAIDLLQRFGSLKGVYENLDKIASASIREKLEKGKKEAFLSYELGKIKTDIPLEDFSLSECLLKKDSEKEKILEFFSQMEFHSLAKRLTEKSPASKGFLEKKEKIKIIATNQEAQAVFARIKKTGKLFLAPCLEENVWGWGLSCDGQTGYFLPFKLESRLREIFQDEKIEKIGHDLKEIMLHFWRRNDWAAERWRNFLDLKIAFYLVKPEAKNDWAGLLAMELGKEIEKKKPALQASLFSLEKKQPSREDLSKPARQALLTAKLFSLFEGKAQEAGLDLRKSGNFYSGRDLLAKVELPLVKILAQMEKTGFASDKEKLERVSLQAKERLDLLEKEIYALAGTDFNINSPQQLTQILFEKIGLSTAGIKKGKTGFSTDAEQLAKLRQAHPIIEKIEKYREIAKLKNTYADALPNSIAEDGRIHAHFNQALTATGRLSCDNPNLQNIPKKGELAEKIRQAFVAEKGYKLLSVDYSQIDLRVAAHLSGDKKMIEAFRQGKDIHRITAAWVNGIPEEEVSSRQRSEAKSLNFGVLYGMGIYGFMRDSGVNRKRAEFFISEYMRKFSGLKDYLEKTKEEAKKNGFLETQMGRRRYIVGFDRQFGGAERMAINFPIQGLAADIMKLAMVKVFEEFPILWEEKEIRLILQVHDELIFEARQEVAEEWAKKIKTAMEKVFPLAVPLSAEAEIGQNWSEL